MPCGEPRDGPQPGIRLVATSGRMNVRSAGKPLISGGELLTLIQCFVVLLFNINPNPVLVKTQTQCFSSLTYKKRRTNTTQVLWFSRSLHGARQRELKPNIGARRRCLGPDSTDRFSRANCQVSCALGTWINSLSIGNRSCSHALQATSSPVGPLLIVFDLWTGI